MLCMFLLIQHWQLSFKDSQGAILHNTAQRVTFTGTMLLWNAQRADSIYTVAWQTCLAADRSFCSSCCSVVWWRAWEEEAAWARWATCSLCMRCRHAVSSSRICATTVIVHVISNTMVDSHWVVKSHSVAAPLVALTDGIPNLNG